MAITYKVLGQLAPAATTNTDLYTVGAGKSTVVSTLTICNRSSTSATYRIAIRAAGAPLANEDYIAYDTPIAGNDTVALTLGITLATTDIVTVYSSNANLSFNLFGSEMS
jgi:hypothetical protein